LGPLTKLEPGKSIFHTETWEVYTELTSDLVPLEVQKTISAM